MSRRYYGERESYQIEVSKYLKPELVKVLRKHGLDQVALDVEETVDRYGSKTVTLSVGSWESAVIDEIIPLLKEERKACALLKSIQALRLNPKGRVDVYIRRRGDDLQHNAVVAAFLCKLEYFHGLLFLTTNRAADVDDAIVSRMIATFKYDIPDQEASIAIWTILSRQFGLTFSEKAIVSLNKAFPELSGRDIKQLLKLVIKFCSRKKRKMDLEAFRTCAMFRGIV